MSALQSSTSIVFARHSVYDAIYIAGGRKDLPPVHQSAMLVLLTTFCICYVLLHWLSAAWGRIGHLWSQHLPGLAAMKHGLFTFADKNEI